MKGYITTFVVFGSLALLAASPLSDRVDFSAAEIQMILAHGPWPPLFVPDPSNRVSGQAAAVALGRRLFFDPRLSRDQDKTCATCHEPAKTFTDAREHSLGIAPVDRNAIALLNLRRNRWFGWDGKSDNLWAQSIHPILDARELGASAELVATRLGTDASFASAYAQIFGSPITTTPVETVLVNIAKALAAFQEAITTGRTPFDAFRDALAAGDRAAMARYPLPAQHGLKIFVGKGQCSVCHFGPHFTNGEFHDIGLPFFIAPGRVDPGRHGGITRLQASRYNLLGPYNDDPTRSTAGPTRYVQQLHRNWGEFRVPSLRQAARTAPYMHNGSLATLEDVVRHYSELNEERLHSDGERLLRPLRLTAEEVASVVSFLQTLAGPIVGYEGL
jgi:cytochrome c peroxidase